MSTVYIYLLLSCALYLLSLPLSQLHAFGSSFFSVEFPDSVSAFVSLRARQFQIIIYLNSCIGDIYRVTRMHHLSSSIIGLGVLIACLVVSVDIVTSLSIRIVTVCPVITTTLQLHPVAKSTQSPPKNGWQHRS